MHDDDPPAAPDPWDVIIAILVDNDDDGSVTDGTFSPPHELNVNL